MPIEIGCQHPRSTPGPSDGTSFLEINAALDGYLNEATEQIIREAVFGDAEEAEEQAG